MDFYLKREDELLGTLRSYEVDFPWLNCKFEAAKEFDAFRPLFDEERRLLENIERDKGVEEWEKHWQKILDLNIRLVAVEDERMIDEFLLHIEGDEARFRM